LRRKDNPASVVRERRVGFHVRIREQRSDIVPTGIPDKDVRPNVMKKTICFLLCRSASLGSIPEYASQKVQRTSKLHSWPV
jgi:hypothetical protein